MARCVRLLPALVAILWCREAVTRGHDAPASVFEEDLERVSSEARSADLACRIGAARALGSLAHRRALPSLVELLGDAEGAVRREAAFGLGRTGGRKAVEALLRALEDEDALVRVHARAGLERLLGRRDTRCSLAGAQEAQEWRLLIDDRLAPAAEAARIEGLAAPAGRLERLREIAALGGGPETERALIALFRSGGLERGELAHLFRALEAVASTEAVPVLGAGMPRYAAAAWALGNIGGRPAEQALLDGIRRAGRPDLHVLANLDRLRSGALFPHAPMLLESFGLVSFRSQPDDLHLDPTAAQRVAARLLIRTGRSREIVELLLAKLESTRERLLTDGSPPPVRFPGTRDPSPEEDALAKLINGMDEELRPGFHRADGRVRSLALAALPHLVTEPELAPRLIALLDHPALVARVYVATALARLRLDGAAREIAARMREPYAFDDATTQASGKHGPETSGTVRWKGYLAMALGLDASEAARGALEEVLAGGGAPRDVRFGAVVGLLRIGDSRSLPVLVEVARNDPVRWIRRTAAARFPRPNGNDGATAESRAAASHLERHPLQVPERDQHAGHIASSAASPRPVEPARADSNADTASPEALLAALRADPTPALALDLVRAEASEEVVLRALADPRARRVTAAALADRPVAPAREALEAIVISEDQVAAYHAARALGALADPRSLEVLASCVADAPRRYWELAFRTRDGYRPVFHRIREGRDETIFAGRDVPNLRVARAALEAIGALAGAEAQAVLERGLESDQHLVRYGAVLGLARRGDASRPILARVASSDPVLYVRRAARRALESMAAGTDERPAAPEPPAVDRLRHVPAIAFVTTRERTESNLGFRDSYFFPKTPWYAWGDDLWVLAPPAPGGELRNLTQLADGGRVQGCEVSPDGLRLLAGLRRHRREPFHIWEIDAGTGERRQITSGPANDVDPCYLPGGRIAFSSDRDGTLEYYHQERVRTIHVVDARGGEPRQIAFNPNQDYEPLALRDGRILYSSYRFYGQDGSGGVFGERPGSIARIETQLRSMFPDGSGDSHVYGSHRGGFYVPLRELPDGDQFQAPSLLHGDEHLGVSVSQARELDDGRLLCITPSGLTIVDPRLDPRDCELPLHPEVLNLAGGEEVYIHDHDDQNPIGRYTSPWPVGGGLALVSHAPWYRPGGAAYGIWLIDLETGAQTLVHDDPSVSEVDPMPLAPWPAEPGRLPARRAPARPAETPPQGDSGPPSGTLVVASVFESDLDFDRSRVRYVRVVAGEQLGVSMNANGAFRTRTLATVPIEDDGSVHVQVPADTPIHFDLLDGDEQLLVHETAFMYVRPGETRSCIGCHERKNEAPHFATFPLAGRRPPHRALPAEGDLIYMGTPGRSSSVIHR